MASPVLPKTLRVPDGEAIQAYSSRGWSEAMEAFMTEIAERIVDGSLGTDTEFTAQWLMWAKETTSQLDPFRNGSLLQLMTECQHAGRSRKPPEKALVEQSSACY